MSRTRNIILFAFVFLLNVFLVSTTHAQIFSQNQVITPPFGQGYVISTSTSGNSKLGTALINLLGSFVTGTTSASCSGSVSCSPFIVIGSSPVSIIGSGGSGGGLGTTTPWTIGNVAYVTSNGTVGSVATGTLSTGTGLDVTANRYVVGGNAVVSAASGYNIPLTASSTNWNSFYNTPSTRITAGTGLSWSGNTLNSTGGTVYLASTTPWTVGQLAQVASNGTLNSIATSSLNLTVSSFASPNISQWTNNAGYLTTAITSLNGQTGATQTFATTSSNGGWGFSSGSNIHTLNIPTASASNPLGLLSSTDWSTFNGKQAAGNYITALTGDATASGPGSAALTLATVNSNVGSFHLIDATVNAKGLITGAANGVVNLVSDTTGTLGVGNGGTGSTTLSGLLKGNGASAIQTAVLGTDYVNGSGASGNCVQWGASNSLTDAGSACGSGGGTNYFTLTGTNLQNNVGTALGINTAPNLASLEVMGSTTTSASYAFAAWNSASSPLLTVRNDGFAMIGTSSPGNLIARGIISATNNNTDPFSGESTAALALVNTSTTANNASELQFVGVDSTGTNRVASKIVGFFGSHANSGYVPGGFQYYAVDSAGGLQLIQTNQTNGSGFFVPTSVATSSATAFQVSKAGSNPTLSVNTSATSAATGVTIIGGAAGTAPQINAISSGSAEGLTVGTKSTGTLTLRVNGGGSSGAQLALGQSTFTFTRASAGVTTNHFLYQNANDSSITASSEAGEVNFNLANAIRTHATGALALQRDFLIQGTTHAFVGGSTLTDLAALAVRFGNGGANSTITNNSAILIQAQAVASSTNAYGLNIVAPSGATNNYAASTSGRVVMNNLTTSASVQGAAVCTTGSTGGELIAESVACLASAARYKENVQDLDVGLDELMKLRPVSFTWKADFNKGSENDPNKNGVQYSLIADEVQKIDPKLVSLTTGTTTFEGKVYAPGSIQGLADVNHWVALIVKSVQEVATRQDAQEARIEALEKQVAELSGKRAFTCTITN